MTIHCFTDEQWHLWGHRVTRWPLSCCHDFPDTRDWTLIYELQTLFLLQVAFTRYFIIARRKGIDTVRKLEAQVTNYTWVSQLALGNLLHSCSSLPISLLSFPGASNHSLDLNLQTTDILSYPLLGITCSSLCKMEIELSESAPPTSLPLNYEFVNLMNC